MSEVPVIKLTDVSCGYRGGFSVNRISLNVEKGTVCGLIGPNGSGKTTILRAASGNLPIKSGKVEMEGVAISGIKRLELARKMAFVMQESSSPFDMNVIEYVLLGRIPHRKGISLATSRHDMKIASEMLETTGASVFRERNLNELSGGERQLVHIARALTQEPSALFLDEPTNHLDLSHQHQIMTLVKKLSREGRIAVTVVLHDLNIAARFCDRLYLVNHGEIHTSGTPEEVLKPEILESVYGTRILSCPDPVNGKPLIFIPL